MRKKYILPAIFLLIIQICFSQNNYNTDQFNLPPGSRFSIKQYEKIDYSYKLNQQLNLPLDKAFLKFSENEMSILEKKDRAAFIYYSEAKDYFSCLSAKVKKSFTVNELWYIYIYDQELKNKLTLIK